MCIRDSGSIEGGDDLGVVAYDQAHDIQTYACVTNYNSDPEIDAFDPQLAHAAIVTHKEAVISRLSSLTQDGGYQGVNIDFENIAYSDNIEDDRLAFSNFIHDLAARLHADGLKLAISVPGKTEDSIDDPWSYTFDFAALGQEADYLQLMTYDQHGPWGDPGPVSGVDWVEDCLVFASSLVAPSRLLIGLPAYGYDWDLSAYDPESETYSASSFSWTDVPGLLAKPGTTSHWDSTSHSPYVTYTEYGHQHEAWFENMESIHAKSELVAKYHLAGLSMWSLGQEGLSFWQAATE
jgi:spore germination protein